MKAIALFTAAILSIALAHAAEPPSIIELPTMMGKVTLDHAKHREMNKTCTPCHATPEGGKIEGLNKEMTHKICKGCHLERKAGPTECKECHKQHK